MDGSGEHIVTIEAQRSNDEPANERGRVKRIVSMNITNNGARVRTKFSRIFNSFRNYSPIEEEKEEEENEYEHPRLSKLYDLPSEYVPMKPEIFSGMRAGKKEFFDRMKSYKTPMACYKDDKGDSILHIAAALGHSELVTRILFECPCLLLEANLKGQLPIHVAARAGHSKAVKALVQSVTYFSAGLPEDDRERLNIYGHKDINGDTALHLALKDLPEEKTEHGTRGETMYHKIMHLLRNSLDTSTRATVTASCLIKANRLASFLANKDKKSPLYMAVEAGNVSLVKEMMERPGDIVQGNTSNLSSQLEGRRSLVHTALKAKNTDVLDVILNEDSTLVNERDEEGRTCLSVGASVGIYEGICKLLDRSTSNVYVCDDDGSFPIHMAVEKGHIKVVKEILKRCPDSIELLNKHGQNILHIAAKSGKIVSFLMGRIRKLRTKDHLTKEKDVDGNIPLHLAAINWHPLTILKLTIAAFAEPKLLNIKNDDGLRALDIAEINLQSDYVFRERMTLMVLLSVYPSKGITFLQTSGMTLRSRSEQPGCGKKYKDCVNILLLVATLVATVTFAAGFTMPGGFNDMGMAILADDLVLSIFLITDTVAMQSSIVAIIALIWAQLGDQELTHKAFNVALPSLFIALWFMQLAFFTGVSATIKQNSELAAWVHAISFIYIYVTGTLLAAYVIPQVQGVPFSQCLTYVYLVVLCYFVNEEDAEKHEPLALVTHV